MIVSDVLNTSITLFKIFGYTRSYQYVSRSELNILKKLKSI